MRDEGAVQTGLPHETNGAHQKVRKEVRQRLRDEVWRMRSSTDIGNVLSVLREGLQELGVPFDDCGVNVVDPQSDPPSVHIHSLGSQGEWLGPEQAWGADLVLRFWRQGTPAYRRDLQIEDVNDERERHVEYFGHSVRCVLDVPFSHGTVAVSSRESSAFSEEDVANLEHLAVVLEDGFKRREDLLRLEQRNQELLENVRQMTAYQSIGQSTISSLEREQVLDNLAQHVVQAGVFRSLMIAMVNHESQHVEVVRNYLSLRDGAVGSDLSPDERLEPGGVLTPTPAYLKPEDTVTQNERIVGTKYSLDDDNVTAIAARTGETMVIDGWDDRFDERISFRHDVSRNVSYFVPVKHGDRVVAVLATGSPVTEKAGTLRRIEAMHPLLNQVAIALVHARLYEVAQHEIAERKQAEEALRREAEIRESEASLRLAVARMEQPDQVYDVLREVSSQLLRLGVEHGSCSLQIVNADATDFDSCRFSAHDARDVWIVEPQELPSDLSWTKRTTNAEACPWVLETWRSGNHCQTTGLDWDTKDVAILDVAFSHGTIGINRISDPFSSTDIGTLERFAPIVSEGFQRFLDLSERMQAEEALRESEERYRTLVETPPNLVVMLMAPDGAYRYVSPQIETLTGHSPKEFYSNIELGEIITHPDDLAEGKRAFGQAVEGTPVQNLELRFRLREGSYGWVQETILSILGADGEVGAVQAIFQDITERKQAEQALVQSSRLIALGQMAAGMAHELNQPLTVISAMAEGLQIRLEHGIEMTPERLKRWSKDVIGGVERMSSTIEHLRIFSRDRSEEPEEQVALTEVVQASLIMTQAQLKSRGVDVTLDLCADLAPITGDRYRLEQVLEPFYTTKEPDRGTGLGLSISHAIVKDHGGEIECESTVGEGTVFRVRLPVVQESSSAGRC